MSQRPAPSPPALVPLVALVLALGLPRIAAAQGAYTPGPENAAARAWYQDAKYGMFKIGRAHV